MILPCNQVKKKGNFLWLFKFNCGTQWKTGSLMLHSAALRFLAINLASHQILTTHTHYEESNCNIHSAAEHGSAWVIVQELFLKMRFACDKTFLPVFAESKRKRCPVVVECEWEQNIQALLYLLSPEAPAVFIGCSLMRLQEVTCICRWWTEGDHMSLRIAAVLSYQMYSCWPR